MTDHIYFQFQLTGEYNCFFLLKQLNSIFKISTEHLASISYEDSTFILSKLGSTTVVSNVDAVQTKSPTRFCQWPEIHDINFKLEKKVHLLHIKGGEEETFLW